MKNYTILFAIIFSFTTNVFSQIEFTSHIITPGAGATTNGPVYVVALDVENDGDLDFVSASVFDDKVAWYENKGYNSFEQHTISNQALGVTWLDAIDMDHDGDMDVLSASLLDDKVAWYENDGFGVFKTHVVDSTINPTGWGKFSVSAYDIDGDEDIDVFSGSWDSAIIEWHENDGNQNFTTHLIDNPGQRSHVIAKDMDGDGDSDLISVAQVSSTVAWHENDGDENFSTHIISDSADYAKIVVATDLDKDGDIDVLATLFGNNRKVEWYENDGNQNFTIHAISSSPGNSGAIYVDDMDNDGDLDILTATANANMVGWLENEGEQNFTFHVITTDVSYASAVWGGDLDGDGDMDVLACSRDGDQVVWYESDLITGVANTEAIPFQFNLSQNYPNPFNPTTIINYNLPSSSLVELKIYNTLGQEVRTLVNAGQSVGSHQVVWDGRDNRGNDVPNGVYFYQLQAGAVVETRKMVLMR